MNQYQDSRRVLNPGLQEEPRQIKQRSISQTAKLLTWEPAPIQMRVIPKRDDKIFGQQAVVNKPPPKREQDRIFGQEIEQRQPTRGNLKNESNLFKDCCQLIENKMRRKVPIVQHHEPIHRKKLYKDRNEGHGVEYLYGQSDKENKENKNQPKPQLIIQVQETIPSQRMSVKSKTTNQRTSKSCHQQREEPIIISKKVVQPPEPASPKLKKFKPPLCASRPQSAMCDRSIDIIEMQLGGTKNQDSKYFKELCQKQGFHMVGFQEQVNALRDTGHAKMMMRGVSNPHKLNYIHQQLDAQGITIEEPRHQLKNILQNEYLLELNKYEKQQQSQDQLMQNFKKFYQRQQGQFI